MPKDLKQIQSGHGNLQAGRDIIIKEKDDDITVPELKAIVKKFLHTPIVETEDFKIIKIRKKNKLNGISPEYYMEIKKDSVYSYDLLESMLKDPINESLRIEYQELTLYLKNQYLLSNLKGNMERFIFKAIENFDFKTTTIKERNWGIRLLNFMYLRCDIGIK